MTAGQHHATDSLPRCAYDSGSNAQRFSSSEATGQARWQHRESAAHRWRNGSGGCALPLLVLERGALIVMAWAPRRRRQELL